MFKIWRLTRVDSEAWYKLSSSPILAKEPGCTKNDLIKIKKKEASFE